MNLNKMKRENGDESNKARSYHFIIGDSILNEMLMTMLKGLNEPNTALAQVNALIFR
ncbi:MULTISPECIES: hypothetical protein [Priestia]|uniref:hypothetical protein n=1 Tax=Priestia TaxID=2800373 RepID=UPI00189ED603|nr:MULTISPECIES: hypothetical protein [Priestia]